MIIVKIIDKQNERDINIKNEPFLLFGRLAVGYADGKWSYETHIFAPDAAEYMCFPDEGYCFDDMAKDSVFIGAYDGDECIGLAIMREHFLKYMYLYDLKVNAAYRGRGVGKQLLQKAKEVAAQHDYKGIYTIGQDNNDEVP